MNASAEMAVERRVCNLRRMQSCKLFELSSSGACNQLRRRELLSTRASYRHGSYRHEGIRIAMPSSKIYAEPARDEGITDIAIIGGGPACVAATKKLATLAKRHHGGDLHVTVISGNAFTEWSLGATMFLADPSKHDKLLCGDPTVNQLPQISSYVYGAVSSLDAESKTI